MSLIGNLYPLRKKGKDSPMFKSFLKSFLGETTKAGETIIDKPLTASKRLWVMALYTLLVIANKKFDLGLTEQELTQLAAIVGAYVTFQSIEDAWKRTAAIAKHMKPEPVKPGEEVPGLSRG